MVSPSRWPSLAALCIAAAAACSPSNAAREPTPASASTLPVSAQLVPGQRVSLPGGDGVRYIALVSDSRCPPGAQCVQAGEAILRFEFQAGGRRHPFELSTAAPRNGAVVEGYRVWLLEAARDPASHAGIMVDRAG